MALRLPFKTQTISLIGFSLGTQVVKSCLKTLNSFYAGFENEPVMLPCDLIHDVVIMGGASHYVKNLSKYKNISTMIINGQFKNIYSKNDQVLYLYSLSEFVRKSAGRNKVDFGDERYVRNYDVSKNVVSKRLKGMGHLDYMDESILMEILLNIDFR